MELLVARQTQHLKQESGFQSCSIVGARQTPWSFSPFFFSASLNERSHLWAAYWKIWSPEMPFWQSWRVWSVIQAASLDLAASSPQVQRKV